MRKRILSMLLAICAVFSLVTVIAPSEAQAGSWGLKGDGWYQLTPACASGKVLDVSGGSTKKGANIQIYESNSTDAQRFHLTSIGGGYYIITNKASGKVLDVDGGKTKSGTNVQQWDYKSGTNQVFKIESAGNGYYYLKPKNNTNLALDVSGGKSANSTNVQVYTWSKNNKAQMWKLWCMNSAVEAYSSVSSIKSTTKSKPASFNVNANGTKSTVTVWACNTDLTNTVYQLQSSSSLNVLIVSGNKTIVNEVFKGKSKTFTIPAKYTSYTVYVSRYVMSGNNILTQTIAGGKNFTNLGYYCQVSLNNAIFK